MVDNNDGRSKRAKGDAVFREALEVNLEKPGKSYNGYLALILALVAFAASAFIFSHIKIWYKPYVFSTAVPLALIGLILLAGLYMLSPNMRAAILLFGEYRGTDRTNGLRWIWPWMTREKISVRTNNVTSEKIKVNDLRGNPIIIATNVVWRVQDTAKALFDVEDYKKFVDIQIESAVRVIGARYPYDDLEGDEVTLRGDTGEISDELEKELQDRVEIAGVIIDECRLTHLAYAPEIAQAMLRRQQAEAVVAARHKLVEGAVLMVESALEQLSAKQVVELDDERKAAMVSNLMVVLCGERDTQPVVNAGSLY